MLIENTLVKQMNSDDVIDNFASINVRKKYLDQGHKEYSSLLRKRNSNVLLLLFSDTSLLHFLSVSKLCNQDSHRMKLFPQFPFHAPKRKK